MYQCKEQTHGSRNETGTVCNEVSVIRVGYNEIAQMHVMLELTLHEVLFKCLDQIYTVSVCPTDKHIT